VDDYGRALRLNPSFAAASLNRGIQYCHLNRHPEARADLERALAEGADPAVIRGYLESISKADPSLDR
jgi:hypothetical protein